MAVDKKGKKIKSRKWRDPSTLPEMVGVINDYNRFKLDFLKEEDDGRIMNGDFDVTYSAKKLYGVPTGKEEVKLIDYLVYRPVPKELLRWRDIPKEMGQDSLDLENWYRDLMTYAADGVWIDGEYWNPYMVYWLNIFVFQVYILDEDGDPTSEFTSGHPFYCNIDRYLFDLIWKARCSGQDFSLMGGRGIGKALSLDTKVLTKELGYINNGDLKVGQHVYNRLGNPVEILQVHDHYNKSMYRVNLSDGRYLEVCDEHLWGVYDNKGKVTIEERYKPTLRYPKGKNKRVRGIYKVMSTLELIEEGLTYSSRGDSRFSIPMQKAVEYPSKNHYIMPYTLGAIIGDGCVVRRTVSFTNHPDDIHIVNRMNKELKNIGCRLNPRPSSIFEYGIISDTNYHNQVTVSIEALGLSGLKSHDKFIPEEYKLGSVKQRMDLLKGLMDTDGYCTKSGTPQFCTTSDILKDDVLQLCASLGIRAEAIRKNTPSDFGYAWTITLKTNEIVFDLPRKLSRQKLAPGNKWVESVHSRVPIVSIEYIGIKDARCISIDDPEYLYQAGLGHVVTHNSYVAGCVMDREYRIVPGGWNVVSSTNEETTNEAWNKIDECLEAIEQKHKALKHKRISNSGTLKYSGEIIELADGTTEKRGYLSKFEKIIYGKNGGKTRGKRPTIQLVEEFAAFPPSSQKGSLRSCMRESRGSWYVGGSIKKCTVMYTGTGGTVENDEAADIFLNPTAHEILPVFDWPEGQVKNSSGEMKGTGAFIPTHLKRSGTWESTGCPDIATATEETLEEREKAMADPISYMGLLQEYPMTIKEVFMRKGVNIFNQDKISEQRMRITVGEGPKPERGFLDWEYFENGSIKGVKWTQSIYGDISIVEHPHWLRDGINKEDAFPMPNLYVAGCDSIDQGNSDSSVAINNKSGSELAILVKKRIVDKGFFNFTSNLYVAMYHKRSDNVKDDWDNAAKLSYYYHAEVNIEYARINIVGHFRNLGLYKMLKKRPTINQGNPDPSKPTNLIGTTTAQNIRDHQDEKIAEYINDYYDTIWFLEMLEQCQDYDRDNRTKFDLVVAFGLCELSDEDLMGKAAKAPIKESSQFQLFGYYTDPDTGYKAHGIIPSKGGNELERSIKKEANKFQEHGGVIWRDMSDPNNPVTHY